MSFVDKVKKGFGEAVDYVAPKAKAAGHWMQDRGDELNGMSPRNRSPSPYKKGSTADKQFMTGYNNGMISQGKEPYHERRESPAYERAEHRGRKPRERREPREPMGMGMGNMDLFGVGNFGMEAPEEREEAPRRRKSRRRPAKQERNRMMEPGHVPDYLRHMF